MYISSFTMNGRTNRVNKNNRCGTHDETNWMWNNQQRKKKKIKQLGLILMRNLDVKQSRKKEKENQTIRTDSHAKPYDTQKNWKKIITKQNLTLINNNNYKHNDLL